jgi:hypothetical protein
MSVGLRRLAVGGQQAVIEGERVLRTEDGAAIGIAAGITPGFEALFEFMQAGDVSASDLLEQIRP